MSCNNELRGAGKPYPRTCVDCGLGPCKKSVVDLIMYGASFSVVNEGRSERVDPADVYKDNVVRFTGVTKLDLDPDVLLNEAIGKLKGAIIIGYDKDGKEFFSSSYADGGTVLWLMLRAKKALLETADEGDSDEDA